MFVFDGPNKPVYKRNKRSGRGDGVATAQAKRLIRLFGFPVHDAPGEAEAECALLQRHGIVDAVLSEDVDTIMFGCTRTLRNWSSASKSAKTPTHVSLYDVNDNLDLDREGMVLVALMSGGDYLPDGLPGCGVKVACEAAKAGFGKSLCALKSSDKEGIAAWRANLAYELQRNESGYFRIKHKALTIPEDFPNIEVLRYYTHPVVSLQNTLPAIREKVLQQKDIALEPLREFARETFDWDYREGAIKFIRVLGQAMLVHKLRTGRNLDGDLVRRISGRRTHFSTDATPELRLSYIPQDVVPIDLTIEAEESIAYGREGLSLNSDDEFDAPADEAAQRQPKAFDVTVPDLAWVLECAARKYAAPAVKAWEEAEEAKALRKSPKKSSPKKKAKGISIPDKTNGSLDSFVRITKKSSVTITAKEKELDTAAHGSLSPVNLVDEVADLPPPSSLPSAPRTPPREPCKQSTNCSAASSPQKHGSRSHVTPRPSNPASSSEAILISSSPAGPPSPASPSPSKSVLWSQGAAVRPEKVTSSVHSILASNAAKVKPNVEAKKATKSTKPTKSSMLPPPSQSSKFKQTSLDFFAPRKSPAKLPPKDRPDSKPTAEESGSKPIPDDDVFDADSSGLEPLSALVGSDSVPSSPSKRRSTEIQLPSREGSPTPSPSRKKKVLLVPSSSDGFLREIEVAENDRDAVAAREQGVMTALQRHGHVARWSDVSVIDLTQE